MKPKAEKLFRSLMGLFTPPKRKTVWEWADENRILASESSAEPGKWHSDKTPYMIPIMEAFTDPNTYKIVVMAGAQLAKSELLNNCFGYLVTEDPGPVLWINPTVSDAESYSKQRLSVIIRDTPVLRERISLAKSRDGNNTILDKSFPGGHLNMIGANAPSPLRSKPIRYVLGDECDAWPISAGSEGDPTMLAEKRTITYRYNKKIVLASTPTIHERSAIERGYSEGTQEEWQLECPNCGEYHFVTFSQIEFEREKRMVNLRPVYQVSNVRWRCPDCGFPFTEQEMKRQPGKMIAQNPEVEATGIRSFRMNAFVSPWVSWEEIAKEFLLSKDDPMKLQVVYNTMFGEPFEDRGDLEEPGEVMERREDYGAELPDGVLVLTMGVDTQDDRLEYEVVGHGLHGETWGIQYGVLPGDPGDPGVWEQLDEVIDRVFRFSSGVGLPISRTFIDSGGHRTKAVYENCRIRQPKRVFAIKGIGGESRLHVGKPKKQEYLAGTKSRKCWLYPLGVDTGKAMIMSNLRVQRPGPKYCHFPLGGRGYDEAYFNGLLSERMTMKRKNGQNIWAWEVIPGHERNEPLDVRNYALAAFGTIQVDLTGMPKLLKTGAAKVQQQEAPPSPRQEKKTARKIDLGF